MKIGFFTDSYKPYMSGVVKSIESFTDCLQEMGHEVYIFAPDYPGVEVKDYIYRFKSVPVLTNPGFRLAIPISNHLLAEVKKLKLDIIHTHTPFLMGWLARKMARRLELPLVFTYHTLYEKYVHYTPIGQELARKVAVKYSKEYCQTCDLIITPSNFVKKMLRNYGVTTPLYTVSTGIKLVPYKEGDGEGIRQKYGIRKDEKLLLFVGRLGQEKNLEFLLKTYKEINAKLSHTKLMLVGDGPQRVYLEELRNKLCLQKEIIFAGWQKSKEVVNFYLAADLFVFPSSTETQGLVTLEAMAGGLPVVAVAAGGSRVMVDDGLNGLLVSPDKYYFTQAVVNILTRGRLYHLLQKNAVKKAAEYSIKSMTGRLIYRYQDLLRDEKTVAENLA